jgi:hypothetical protein
VWGAEGMWQEQGEQEDRWAQGAGDNTIVCWQCLEANSTAKSIHYIGSLHKR